MKLFDKAMQYADDVVSGKEKTTEEVIIQCKWFKEDLERQEEDEFLFYMDMKKLKIIQNLLLILNFATGLGVRGKSILSGLENFQAFFIVNVFGWRFKSNHKRFRYRDITLFIPRKNAKTFLCAVVLILLMLTEPTYSEFYSICLDRELAGQTKKAVGQILSASPLIVKKFKIPLTLKGQILCKITNNFYQARTAEANRNNAIMPSAFIADEVGAFTDKKNIMAMRSGQLNVENPLTFMLTTAYAEDKSVMLGELDYIRKVYKGLIKNERMFALLYYAPKEHLWDDEGLEISNPLRIEQNYEEVRATREKAYHDPTEKEEFLTKHVNYFMPSNSGEAFVRIEDVQAGKVEHINWSGRDVWIGLDLSATNDNTSFSMCTLIDDELYADSYAFIPKKAVKEKINTERVPYDEYIKAKKCFACGKRTISYKFIEEMVLSIEEAFDVTVRGVGYDFFNCLSTANKLESKGMRTVEVVQHSKVLHGPTKFLEECILDTKFHYEENPLFEINFQNAKVVYDTNKNKYINKKKSTGKIDMVAALINAIYLMMQDLNFDAEDNWGVQS